MRAFPRPVAAAGVVVVSAVAGVAVVGVAASPFLLIYVVVISEI